MSRLDDDIKNPATIFLKWDGTNGGFNYWDKSKADETKGIKGENVHVKLPFEFMALDTLATVKGYSDSSKSGFWSNEIRNTKKDSLTVRTKAGVAATGLYADVIKDKACTGAKYCQSVYILATLNGKAQIANIQMMGTALSAWIDYGQKNKIFKGAISISKMKEGKKGATTYQTPIFESIDTNAKTEAKATEMAKELMVYLEKYLGEKQAEVTETSTDNS